MPIIIRPLRAQSLARAMFSPLVLAALFVSCQAAFASTQPVQQIVIPDGANAQEQAAAKELSTDLARMLPAPIPVVTESKLAPGAGATISVGRTRAAALAVPDDQLKPLGPEGFIARRADETLVLVGKTPIGTGHAVLAYLEHLGFRWFSRGELWTVTPDRRPEITLDDWHLTDQPVYLGRELWPLPDHEAPDNVWARHARLAGGSVGSFGGHSYFQFCDPNVYFDKHPEYFALVGGKRHKSADGFQLCVSNPEVQALAIAWARQRLTSDPSMVVPISPNDGAYGFCQCEHCRALGSPSDQTVFLANTVARAIKGSYPHAIVGFYAYSDAEYPPHIDADPNVIAYIATSCHLNGNDTDDLIEGWRPHLKLIGIRDYVGVLPWDWMMPRFSAPAYQKVLQTYRHEGAIAWGAECSDDRSGDGVNQYLISKLLWNPDQDLEPLAVDWSQKLFRRAAAPMRRYLSSYNHGMKTGDDVILALQSLKEANRLENDPVVVARLDSMAEYVHYVVLFRAAGLVPDNDPKAHKAALTKLCRYMIDIAPTHTIDSYRMVETYLPLPGFTPAERAALVVPPKPPTHDAVMHDIDEDLAAAVPFGAKVWSGTWASLRPVSASKATGIAATFPIRYRNTVLVWATAGKPLRATLTNTRIGEYNDPVRLRLQDLDGKQLAIASADIGKTATLEQSVPTGLYRLIADSNAQSGQLKVDGSATAYVADPDVPLCGVYNPQPTPLLLWVPRGTRHIGFTLRGDGGGAELIVRDPKGSVVIRKQGQLTGGGAASIEVPAALSGQAWQVSFRATGNTAYLGIWGVPPLLVQDASNVFVESTPAAQHE